MRLNAATPSISALAGRAIRSSGNQKNANADGDTHDSTIASRPVGYDRLNQMPISGMCQPRFRKGLFSCDYDKTQERGECKIQIHANQAHRSASTYRSGTAASPSPSAARRRYPSRPRSARCKTCPSLPHQPSTGHQQECPTSSACRVCQIHHGLLAHAQRWPGRRLNVHTSAGVPLHIVAEILDHTSSAMNRRYVHFAPEHLTDARAKLA